MGHKHLEESLHNLFNNDDNTGFNTFDFVYKYGSPVSALLHSAIFWPELMELDGMVFLASEIETDNEKLNVRKALMKNKGDRTKVEKIFNLIEVEYLFSNQSENIPWDKITELAQRLARMWKARLHEGFPSREFVVNVIEEDSEEHDLAIVFWQKREP